MTRLVLLIVWLAIAATSAACMAVSVAAAQDHWLVTWANTGAVAMLAVYCVRADARTARLEDVTGAWRSAAPRGARR